MPRHRKVIRSNRVGFTKITYFFVSYFATAHFLENHQSAEGACVYCVLCGGEIRWLPGSYARSENVSLDLRPSPNSLVPPGARLYL